MAKIIGDPSRNASEESIRHSKKRLCVALCTIAALSFIGGYSMGTVFPIKGLSFVFALPIVIVLFVLVLLIDRWTMSRIDAIERDRAHWRRGAAGERSVAEALSTLSDDFTVIHDLTKRFGNIDHVVIGPTGIYVIDAKNWRGTVVASRDGELLCNGTPSSKPEIRRLQASVMDFQNKIKALTERDYFVRGLMVFTSAFVEATFGSTRHIHCLREDRVVDYIENETFANALGRDDIQRITTATLQIAGMDERFKAVAAVASSLGTTRN